MPASSKLRAMGTCVWGGGDDGSVDAANHVAVIAGGFGEAVLAGEGRGTVCARVDEDDGRRAKRSTEKGGQMECVGDCAATNNSNPQWRYLARSVRAV